MCSKQIDKHAIIHTVQRQQRYTFVIIVEIKGRTVQISTQITFQ